MSLTDPAVETELADAPIQAGETFGRSLRYSAAQIAEFARLSGDTNPLHLDAQAARQAAFGDVIASGQHSAALMMGLVASHFSRHDGGVRREVLCLNFNFAFKAPIQADHEVSLRWTVASVEHNPRLGGWLGQLNGTATNGADDCVVARGTVLVKRSG